MKISTILEVEDQITMYIHDWLGLIKLAAILRRIEDQDILFQIRRTALVINLRQS